MLDNKSEQERIGKEKIPQALEALRSLDAKELPDVPARVAIRQMRRQIERVLKLGYTYDEVSEVLAGLDIHISGNRIKYLLSEVRKETRSRKKKADNETALTSLGASSESQSATLHGAEHNGLSKQSPQSEPQSQPQLQSKQQSQTQPQPQSKRQSQTQPQLQSQPQPQSETQEQSSTVDVDSLTDDYEPMTLRRR